MIKLKPRPDAPEDLSSLKVIATKEAIRKKVSKGLKPSSSKPSDYPSHWLPNSRNKLWLHQNKKCCFCEREREEKFESDLEHFRPKAKVAEEPGHFGYWWLAYEWENYLFSCKPCNEAFKKSHFPIHEDGVRADKEGDDLSLERPLLINPFDDNPEQFISFDWDDCLNRFVKAVSNPINDIDNRGKETIEKIKLNRIQLVEARGKVILSLRAIVKKMDTGEYLGNPILIDAAKIEIKRETSSDLEFTGFRRAFFRKWGFREYINDD